MSRVSLGVVQLALLLGDACGASEYSRSEAEAAAEAPHAEAPHAEAPHAEAPHAEAPHAEAPHAEAPHAEAPHAEAPHAEAPHAEAPHAEAEAAGAAHVETAQAAGEAPTRAVFTRISFDLRSMPHRGPRDVDPALIDSRRGFLMQETLAAAGDPPPRLTYNRGVSVFRAEFVGTDAMAHRRHRRSRSIRPPAARRPERAERYAVHGGRLTWSISLRHRLGIRSGGRGG